MSDSRYRISYDGDDVVTIAGLGVFQRGTQAWVSEQVARSVMGGGGRWSCVDSDGRELGAAPAPRAEEAPREKAKGEKPKQERAEAAEPAAAKAEKSEPAKAEPEAAKSEPAKDEK